jgi:hypothetical protein
MVGPEGPDPGDAGLDFTAHNDHDPRCGRPLWLRNTADPGLYYGDFENRYGEQFVFTFDRGTGTGTVSGGDLGWDNPKSFTLGQLEEVARDMKRVAVQPAEQERTQTAGVLVIDAALALGRVTGPTGRDEVGWLRPCLAACTILEEQLGDYRSSEGGSPTPS